MNGGQTALKRDILVRIPANPADKCGHPKAVQCAKLGVAGKSLNTTDQEQDAGSKASYLTNCGIGRVDSRPKATYPNICTKTSILPKMRVKMVKQRLGEPFHVSEVGVMRVSRQTYM